MLKFIVLTFVFSISALALPTEEISGQNISQKKIAWVWQHRKHFLQSCLTDEKICGKNDSLKTDLQKIYSLLQTEYPNQLFFASETEKPDLFKSDAGETHRVAMTGTKPGSPVYFNADRISSLNFEQIVGLVFHELSHHTGLLDDSLRKPDQIGARLAQHFIQQMMISFLDQQKKPALMSAVFQFSPPVNLDGSNSFGDFGFVTDGKLFFNLNFNAFTGFPACDRTDAVPLAQMIDTGLRWQTRAGGQIRVSTPIRNLCVWVDKVNRKAGADPVLRGFTMDFNLDPDDHIVTSSLVSSLAENIDTAIDQVTTLQLIDARFDKTFYAAGDLVKAEIKLKNFAPSNATVCAGGVAHESAPLQTMGWPVMENLTSCRIVSHEKDLFTLAVTYQLTPLQKSGLHTIPVLRVTGPDKTDLAMATLLKKEIQFLVQPNPASENKIEFVSVESKDLKILDHLGSYPLVNSFVFADQSTWTFDVRVKSKLKVSLRALEASFFIGLNGKLNSLSQSGDPKDLTHYLKGIQYLTEGENQILRLTISLPKMIGEQRVYGLNLLGLLIQDEALNFLDFKKSTDYQYFFMSNLLLGNN